MSIPKKFIGKLIFILIHIFLCCMMKILCYSCFSFERGTVRYTYTHTQQRSQKPTNKQQEVAQHRRHNKLLSLANYRISNKLRQIHHIFHFLLFLLVCTSADIIFHKFLEPHSSLSVKKILVRNCIFHFNGFTCLHETDGRNKCNTIGRYSQFYIFVKMNIMTITEIAISQNLAK